MKTLMADKYFRTSTDKERLFLFEEIEHIVNCRPVTQISIDSDDFQTLSPMTLLKGCINLELPSDMSVNLDGLSKLYHATQSVADLF